MTLMLIKITLLLIHFKLFKTQEDVETTTEPERFCRQRNRLIGSDRSDLYNLVEATIGEKIMLQCHFCNEDDDGAPKVWFKHDTNNNSKYEVKLDMENNMTLNRIHVNAEHTLTIHNITIKDAGEYLCIGPQNQEEEHKYNFFIDVILNTNLTQEKGNLTAWKKYHDENFLAINRLFNHSQDWAIEGPCEICGRPKGDGKIQTKGHCRIKITSNEKGAITNGNSIEKFVGSVSQLSCRSMTLSMLVPGIANRTKVIADFIRVERCNGTCNPDAEGMYKGWKTSKKMEFKYRKTFVLAENSHLTIVCPESTLENKVEWRLNGRLIKTGDIVISQDEKIEPKISVDTFNTLYLYEVTKEEEGNYTCYVDGVRMQRVKIFVVSKSKLLTQAFVRHMMYLGFVLSLTLSCYCCGLIITWTRRRTFKDFETLRAELIKANKLQENDSDEESSTQLITDTAATTSQPETELTTTTYPTDETVISPDITPTSASNSKKSGRGKRTKATMTQLKDRFTKRKSKKTIAHADTTDNSLYDTDTDITMETSLIKK